MPWPVHPTGFFGARGDNDTYRIERSLRFNSADSAYLNRTPASAGNRKTWTWSGWVKRSALSGTIQLIESAGTATSTETTRLYFGFGGTENFIIGYGGADWRATTQLFRDISSWYHIVVAFDSGNATALDRIKLYVNGSQITSFSTTNTVTLNTDGALNNNIEHFVGRDSAANQYYFNGYLTEINFIDGQALTPSSFGETDPITGRWKAKAYSGTYGTNGFYLKFADNSGTTSTTLGKDSSPNGNNWTPNNFSVTAGAGNDSLVDSPTNYGTDSGVGGEVRGNYCTLNPLKTNSTFTLSNGNLDFSATSSAINSLYVTSSVGISSGKWYWEVTPSDIGAGPNIFVGIRLSSASTTSGSSGVFDSGYGYGAGGNKLDGTGGASYGASYANNDVVGIALDLDAGTIVFYKNGVSQGTAFSGLSGTFEPAINLNVAGVSRTIAGFCNFGQRPFAYTAPTGFKALCTTNLPTPTIQKPSSYMDVVTFNGSTSGGTVSGLSFSPDFVWGKNRDSSENHVIIDSVRGGDKLLASNTTGSESTNANLITSFNSDGYTYGVSLYASARYVNWAWDEAPIAGMDIVAQTLTSTGINTMSHSLGVVPKMIIAKRRDGAEAWLVYHNSATTQSQYLSLNSTAAVTTSANLWGSSAITSSQFFFNGTINNQYIFYLFAEVEGFSKFGSYTGNGSADGPFVWCGFRPRWVMIKRTDAAGNNWRIWDTARATLNAGLPVLYPNTSDVDDSVTDTYDILCNGFKIRGSGAGSNASSATYIFAAFSESPFKYARAR